MRIAVVGRGRIGGGLADKWEKAGHAVIRIGHDGGDVSAADAVLLAVPGGSLAEALEAVSGLEGKTAIDATNLIGADPPEGFASNAEFAKSKTHGPTAKSFNTNFASLFDRIEAARSRPGNLWAGDEAAREVVEQLNRDAGYEPVYAGPIENAALLEDFLKLVSRSTRAVWVHSSTGWRPRISCRPRKGPRGQPRRIAIWLGPRLSGPAACAASRGGAGPACQCAVASIT